ncbi:diacylglucosamine hydrolase like [Hydrogenimonas sp.]|nr:diacylglucosamine hydrolase like [Hydrogenimonas sp.]
MLVHICCSVDSHFFLQRLREDFPEERLTAFFYDPNIHPYSEYRLRLLDVERSCEKLGVELIEGPYDYEAWLDAVKGFENEPEKGARCEICFDRRFEVSAEKAREIGERRMTSTLLVSPKKSREQLIRTGSRFAKEYGVEFVYVDYRSGGGTQLQQRIAKEERLYRQNYCGCIYGLTKQREQQKMVADELFSPLCGSALPGSIEERLAMYQERLELEEKGVEYRIERHKFLKYRLKQGWVKAGRETLPSYILPYSVLKRGYCKGRVQYAENGIALLNREEIRLMTLERYNAESKSSYGSVKELIYSPPAEETDMKVREAAGLSRWDLSPLIVLETLPQSGVEIFIDSESHTDVREKLVVM